MTVQLSYFAWVREQMGMGGEEISLPDEVRSVAELLAWLADRNAAGARTFAEPRRIRAAIDGAMVGPGAALAGAREIALFPPVTGG